MSTWKLTIGAAILMAGLAPTAHADEFNKLTLLTFSGPVDIPGVTLPAGSSEWRTRTARRPTASFSACRISG
jgi:hypothetical protein